NFNTFTHNKATGSQGIPPFIKGIGFDLAVNFDNKFDHNIVSNNQRGFNIRGGSNGAQLSHNEIFNNTEGGVVINKGDCCPLFTSMEGDHLYNNSPALFVEIRTRFGSPQPPDISLTNVIFDRPAGDLTDFTDLSLADSIFEDPVGFAVYTIDWSAPP